MDSLDVRVKSLLKLARQDASRGDVISQIDNLSYCEFLSRQLVPPNNEAKEMLEALFNEHKTRANQSSVTSQIYLARIYEKRKQEKEAEYWYLKAAQSGLPKALYYAGMFYFVDDSQKSLKYLQKAAKGGYIDAYSEIAALYEDDYDSNKRPSDLENAFKYYEKGIQFGDLSCMYGYGTLLLRTSPNDQNKCKTAFELLLKSASLGYDVSYSPVADCYAKGIGVDKNPQLAFQYYLKNANDGLGGYAAMASVGDCYYSGFGTPRDLKSAIEWYEKASQGPYPFKYVLERLKIAYSELQVCQDDRNHE